MLNIRHLYGRLVPQNLSWSFCVKAEAKLAGLLLRVVPLIFGQLSSSLVKVVWGYAKNVRRIYKSSGPKGLSLYLKTCSVLLQQTAGGMKAKSPMALGCNVARTRRGIPRIINPWHRRQILSGDVGVIRFWLSLFGLYRVIEFPGALKLKTITEAGKDISQFRTEEWSIWVPLFFEKIRNHTGLDWKMDPSKDLDPMSIPFITKSAPNTGGLPSIVALPLDILAFASDPLMLRTLKKWLVMVDGLDLTWAMRPFLSWFEKAGKDYYCSLKLDVESDLGRTPLGEAMRQYHLQILAGTKTYSGFLAEFKWGKPLSFGKLGFKKEPGKIRVFAMVNIITQTLMKPLHQWIFKRLRAISTDGTFDQTAPVERLIRGFRAERQFVASYDLSAATDRLPLLIQMDLLKPLLGEGAFLWGTLLTGRPYRLPKIAKSYNLGYSEVSYAVGQPMGALSSWALLALTHHALVQLAAHNVYPNHKRWFEGYAVLGDDIVIADKAVAREYLRIMDCVGVEIGLAKSLVSSTGSLEFAKRTWIRGRQASPVSLAELIVALCHLGALDQLVRKCGTFINLRVSAVARFAGFGYKNLGRLPVCFNLNNRLGKLIGYLSRPGGVWPMPIEAWLSAIGPGREDRSSDFRRWAVAQTLWSRLIRMLIKRSARFESTLYNASVTKFSDATRSITKERKDPNGRVHKETKVIPVYGQEAKKTLGIAYNKAAWDTFFTEWVAYPFTNRLRKTFEKIDDVLRVLDPNIQPQWTVLGEIWTQVFEADDGLAALPAKIDYFNRESDEVVPSTRLVTLWTKLRTIVSRRSAEVGGLRPGYVLRRTPRRRRRGG